MTEPLRVLIVDDERLARHHLRQLIEALPGMECVGESPNGNAALATLRATPVDVMLLDVQMPGLDGFDVIKAIAPGEMPAIVFVTAHDHHAVKAFDVHATDYLLKPPDPDRLREALDLARSRIQSRTFEQEQLRLRAIVEQLSRESRGMTEIVVRDRGRTTRVPTNEIDWFRADDNYVRVFANSRTHLLRGTLSALEKDLDPHRFIRIHRSVMVNIDRVRELRHSLTGGYAVVLSNGEKLPVSRAHRKRVIQVFRASRSSADAEMDPVTPG